MSVIKPNQTEVKARMSKNSPAEIGELITKNKAKNSPPKVDKLRLAKVYPSEPGKKKLVLAISGHHVYETVVLSHEKLSVLRRWCVENNYSLDESLLNKPKKAVFKPESDSEEYFY